MTSPHRIIIVLGVRRSGTSAMTKGLETMGVSVVDQTLTPFDALNEKGYWEDLEIHDFNTKLINALVDLEQRRRGMIPLTEQEVDFLCEEGFLKKGSDLLVSRLSVLSQPLGLKDPRFSILLPFWKRVFKAAGIAPSYVMALRNPFNTVASMKAFGNHHKAADDYLEKFFWIWVTSMLGALEGSEGDARVVVDYDELLKDPSFQMRRVAAVLKLEIQEERLQDYSSHFINPKLCHYQAIKIECDAIRDTQRFAWEIYQKLFTLTKDEGPFDELCQAREQWRERLAVAHSLLVLAEKNEQLLLQLAILAQQKTIDKMKH